MSTDPSNNKPPQDTQVANFQTSGKTKIAINGQNYELILSGPLSLELKPLGPIPDPGNGGGNGNGNGEIDPNTGTIKKGAKWSTNPGKAETWILKNMDNPSTNFKFVSANDGLNVIADLESKDQALKLQEYFKTHPFPPEPIEEPDGNNGGGGGGSDGTPASSSITLKYQAKQGGEEVKEFSGPDYSDHDGKPRASLYEKNKGNFGPTNAQIGGYVRMKLRAKDQILYKVLSGNHGDPSMAGRCYGAGFEIEGDNVTLHAVKELNHPETPRITDKIEKLFTGKIPPLNGKTVGYRVNHWVNKDKHTVVEFDADFSALDTPPEQLTQAPNQWQPMFRFIDKGDWGLSKDKEEDANIIENSGITYKGKKLGYYFRADEVNEGDASANLEQAIEIQAPN